MNPKFQASVNARDDVTYVKIGGVIDEDNELNPLADRLGGGTTIIDVADVERINSCGVRDWVNWLTRAEKGGAHVVMVQCSPAIVAQINLVNNFTGNGVVKNFFAPYFCPNCDREKLLLVETRDITGTPPFRAPTCRCDECDGPMDFDDMEESYFAFIANSKKVVTDSSLDQAVGEFIHQDERKLRAKSAGTNPSLKVPVTSHTGGTMSSTPVTGKGGSGGSSDRMSTLSGLNSFGGGSSGGKAAAALAELEARRNQTSSVPLQPNNSVTLWLALAIIAILGTGLLGFFLFVR